MSGMDRVAVFPGQGVRASGSEAGLGDRAADVFGSASEALKVDLVELCRSGRSGDADIGSTRWSQPAILTASIAVYEELRAAGLSVDGVSGHSLGEYSALVAAGALGLDDAVRLLAVRGGAMEEAGNLNPGGMTAVLGVDLELVEPIAAAEGIAVAADNAPGQLVVSGRHDALERFAAAAGREGARCVQVKVAGAFHSPAMEPAITPLTEALEAAELREPRLPFWSATTAGALTDPGEIRQALIDQLTHPVRWRETTIAIGDAQAQVFCDVGPGKVLANLVRRTLPDAALEVGEDLLRSGGERVRASSRESNRPRAEGRS